MKTLSKDSICLEGELIYLRHISLSDVTSKYHAWLHDDEVIRYLEVRFTDRSMEKICSFVKESIAGDTTLLLAMCSKSTHEHIGNIKLHRINYHHRSAEISLMIGNKDYWGKGVGVEAIKMLTMYAFDVLGLKKVYAACYDVNIGSQKAFLKAGFHEEGRRRKHYVCDSAFVDAILLACFKS